MFRGRGSGRRNVWKLGASCGRGQARRGVGGSLARGRGRFPALVPGTQPAFPAFHPTAVRRTWVLPEAIRVQQQSHLDAPNSATSADRGQCCPRRRRTPSGNAKLACAVGTSPSWSCATAPWEGEGDKLCVRSGLSHGRGPGKLELRAHCPSGRVRGAVCSRVVAARARLPAKRGARGTGRRRQQERTEAGCIFPVPHTPSQHSSCWGPWVLLPAPCPRWPWAWGPSTPPD